MSFYGGSRLPFARPGNSPNPSLQLAGATQAAADVSCSLNKALRPWLPCSSQAGHSGRGRLSCSSNKSLTPWQCPFMEVQGCRLPGLEIPKPFPPARRRHSGRDLSCSFNKAAVSQAWKQPKPFPAARTRHSGRGRPFLQPEQGPEAVASLQLPGATQAAADFPAAPTSP